MKPWILALAILTLPALAASQDSVTVQLRHGVELRAAGDDAGALAEFVRAYETSHGTLALAQMGLAEQALGQWDGAEIHLRLALASQGDEWIERHRDALASAYALVLPHAHRAVLPAPAVAPVVTVSVVTPHRRLPLSLGAGAVASLGIGISGLVMREAVIAGYNSRCRGFGDPMPAPNCDEGTNSRAASGATALAATSFAVGSGLAIVSIILLVLPSAPRRLALQCGGGPGDIGISCGWRL